MTFKNYIFGDSDDQNVFLKYFSFSSMVSGLQFPNPWHFLSNKTKGSIFCQKIWSLVLSSEIPTEP